MGSLCQPEQMARFKMLQKIFICVFSKHLFQNTLTLLITRARLQHLVFVKIRKFLFCSYETVES